MNIEAINVTTHPDFDDHERVVECHDPDTGLHAFIAVHNRQLGPALGGCRMWPYTDREAALTDVLRLSRGMTYKSAISELSLGGGKAVIVGNPHTGKTKNLLLAMGRFVDSLNGTYITAEDSGTSVADLAVMSGETPHVAGVTRSAGNGTGDGDPSPSTAYGVYIGIKASLAFHFGNDKLKGRRIAIQGVGNVGRRLAMRLADEGADVLIADIHPSAIAQTRACCNVTEVPLNTIHTLPVDVFAPCALGGFLTEERLTEIAAPIIAGAANNQLADLRAGELAMAMGKLYAPDYLINAGGIIDIYAERKGLSAATLRGHLEKIGDNLLSVYKMAERDGLPTQAVADRIAEARFRRGESTRAVA